MRKANSLSRTFRITYDTATIGEFIDIVWFAFWIYWLVSAATSKKTAERNLAGWYVRLLIFVIVIIAVFESGNPSHFINAPFVTSAAGFLIGALLVVLGLALPYGRAYISAKIGACRCRSRKIQNLLHRVRIGSCVIRSIPGILLALLGSSLVGGSILVDCRHPFWRILHLFR